MSSTSTTCGETFDGDVDPAVEQHARVIIDAEHVAHAVLRLVAERPGTCGKLRTARIIGGYPVAQPAGADPATPLDMSAYAVGSSWSLRELTQLVEAMLRGGLIAQTVGVRPLLVLTRAGHRALDALEHPLHQLPAGSGASAARGTIGQWASI